MTEEEKKQIKEKIASRREELLETIASLKEGSRPVEPDRAIGRLTRMEAISARGVSEASLRSAELELQRLENALKRLDDENYGYCSLCEEPIAIGRLLVMPHATRCVECADKK